MKLIKKGKKKKGFTLIELIAVIAIIGILAAVLAPKILGYMEDAKKSKVIAQARTAVMALETYSAKEGIKTDMGITLGDLKTKSGTKYDEYYNLAALDKLDTTQKISVYKQVVDGDEFDITDKGVFSKLKGTSSTGGTGDTGDTEGN